VDAGVEAGGSFVGGQQVRPQRRMCDRVIAVHIGDWICLQRMDFLQQVAVTVEEGAVDSSRARDCGRADRVPRGGGLVEHRNMTVGSVAYGAPEQLTGKALDDRADLYALACTAFHLFTGQPPLPIRIRLY
jgi:serine/threonine protein kinase